MPGKTSRNKGLRGEREFAELVGGRRVPLSGAQRGFENDVLIETPAGVLRAEVKRRKGGFAMLYAWLETDSPPDIVAFRADRKEWLVCMTVETFRRFLDAYRFSGRVDVIAEKLDERLREAKRVWETGNGDPLRVLSVQGEILAYDEALAMLSEAKGEVGDEEADSKYP